MWFNNISAKCGVCGKTDFKQNLIKVSKHCYEFSWIEYRHEECHMEEDNLKKCPCGRGYLKKERLDEVLNKAFGEVK
jgi:hypothetical protein